MWLAQLPKLRHIPFMLFEKLKYPILLAPLGGLASIKLAAAVSNAGGMGSLPMTWTEPDDARRQVQQLRAATEKPFFVNFVLAFPTKSLDACLEVGVPAVTFSWGQPEELVKKVHRSNSKVGIQVATINGAKRALDSGADFIICQGSEAGGHVQSSLPLDRLLPKVVELAGAVPVVAAGGVTDGADLANVLKLGAQAAMLGTRFVATSESAAHAKYKSAIVESESDDSTYTICFNRGWPHATHRVLRNKTLNHWEAAGCPPAGKRPGEGDLIAQSQSGMKIVRYDDIPPNQTVSGEILDCSLYAGTGCGRIKSIPDAADLMADIWAEYQSKDS